MFTLIKLTPTSSSDARTQSRELHELFKTLETKMTELTKLDPNHTPVFTLHRIEFAVSVIQRQLGYSTIRGINYMQAFLQAEYITKQCAFAKQAILRFQTQFAGMPTVIPGSEPNKRDKKRALKLHAVGEAIRLVEESALSLAKTLHEEMSWTARTIMTEKFLLETATEAIDEAKEIMKRFINLELKDDEQLPALQVKMRYVENKLSFIEFRFTARDGRDQELELLLERTKEFDKNIKAAQTIIVQIKKLTHAGEITQDHLTTLHAQLEYAKNKIVEFEERVEMLIKQRS